MARFPIREADIKVLAQNIITGLDGNPDFPDPPFTPAELQDLLDIFIGQGDDQVAAQAAAQQITEAKHTGQENMSSAMKSVLRYAENTVDGNDAKLTALGWGGKSPQTAARRSPTGSSGASCPAMTGRLSVWPWRTRPPSTIRSARQRAGVPGHRGQQGGRG